MNVIEFFKKALRQKRREDFVRREVPNGKIAVIWVDVDNVCYGWEMSADDEVAGLMGIAGRISDVKVEKLERMFYAKERRSNGKGQSKKG